MADQETDEADEKGRIPGKREGDVPDPTEGHGGPHAVAQSEVRPLPVVEGEAEPQCQQWQDERLGSIVDPLPFLRRPAGFSPGNSVSPKAEATNRASTTVNKAASTVCSPRKVGSCVGPLIMGAKCPKIMEGKPR